MSLRATHLQTVYYRQHDDGNTRKGCRMKCHVYDQIYELRAKGQLSFKVDVEASYINHGSGKDL
jgi:hypothetical protein